MSPKKVYLNNNKRKATSTISISESLTCRELEKDNNDHIIINFLKTKMLILYGFNLLRDFVLVSICIYQFFYF